MKVLTVRQPWAGLIFCGKDVENRTWRTSFRGPLLIHASKTADPWPVLPPRLLTRPFAEIADLCQRRGVILGQVTVRGSQLGGAELLSWWAEPGACHWLLADPVLFDTPIPAKGRLGLWDYDL